MTDGSAPGGAPPSEAQRLHDELKVAIRRLTNPTLDPAERARRKRDVERIQSVILSSFEAPKP